MNVTRKTLVRVTKELQPLLVLIKNAFKPYFSDGEFACQFDRPSGTELNSELVYVLS